MTPADGRQADRPLLVPSCITSSLPKPSPRPTQIQRSMPAHPALLALLCSAALVLGAWPLVGASIVTQGGVIADASLPCSLGLTKAAATPSASCAGAELLIAIGRKEADRKAMMVDRKEAAPFLDHFAEAGLVIRPDANSKGLADDHVEQQRSLAAPPKPSRPPVRGGACPPQWLPVLVAYYPRADDSPTSLAKASALSARQRRNLRAATATRRRGGMPSSDLEMQVPCRS